MEFDFVDRHYHLSETQEVRWRNLPYVSVGLWTWTCLDRGTSFRFPDASVLQHEGIPDDRSNLCTGLFRADCKKTDGYREETGTGRKKGTINQLKIVGNGQGKCKLVLHFPFFCVTMKPKWKLSGSEMDVKWCSVEVVPTQGRTLHAIRKVKLYVNGYDRRIESWPRCKRQIDYSHKIPSGTWG